MKLDCYSGVPCQLCKKRLSKHRERRPKHFIHSNDGTYCPECAPAYLVSVGALWEGDEIEVREVRSEGWTSPPVCSSCRISIPVYCNGEES